MEWHYIKKLMSPEVLFVWKISCLYQKQHRVGSTNRKCVNNVIQHTELGNNLLVCSHLLGEAKMCCPQTQRVFVR